MKRRKLVLISLAVIVVIAALIFGVARHNKTQAEQAIQARNAKVDQTLTAIRTQHKKNVALKDDAKRLQALANLETRSEAYSLRADRKQPVIALYKELINKEKAYFTDKNQKSLKKNKLTDDQLKDIKKKDLQAKLAGLNALTDVLNTQRDIVYNDKNFKTLSTEIQHLSERYAERLRQMTQDEDQTSQAAASSSQAAAELQDQQSQSEQSNTGQNTDASQSGNTASGQANTGVGTVGSTTGYGNNYGNSTWNWYGSNNSNYWGSTTGNGGTGTSTTPKGGSGSGSGKTNQESTTVNNSGNQSYDTTGNGGGQASSGADGTNP
ncbi:hypothetical protein [Lacticaseibacillus paracasei]|uniref:hypothetical protein n=1 Tax=Lacticaseibacillus paracasei TaxID=1597 RepID=UPI0015F11EBB|nr:hypothetical protein [Lacticaseibacillus paracasei]